MGASPWHGVAWHGWAIDSRAVCYAVRRLCEQREDVYEAKDDDDPNDARREETPLLVLLRAAARDFRRSQLSS
jgi:hypothetical protein